MIWICHNVSTSIWYELVIVYSISIWYQMVTMYLLPYGTKWSQCIYFHMVRNGHNVSTSIWYEMVTMYLLPYGTKWLQCIYFHMVRIGHSVFCFYMVRNGFWLWYKIEILWYEMVNYCSKRPWYEMVMVRND